MVQFVVEAAGVADGVPHGAATPQSGGGCLAVAAHCACALTHQQALFGADERAVLAVEAVVEPAGVAQVMPGAVPAPQRRCRRSAVDALTGLAGWGPAAEWQ